MYSYGLYTLYFVCGCVVTCAAASSDDDEHLEKEEDLIKGAWVENALHKI
jgi:hypothetical protein